MTDLDKSRIRKAAWAWWNALQPITTKDGMRLPGDRAALAKLRRASSPLEAAAEPEVSRLYDALGFGRDPRTVERELGRVAVLASLLAQVREPSRANLGRALGPPAGAKEGAVLSPLRLRRLLAARGDVEISAVFRRALAMLGNKADIGDLAWQVLCWDRDELGDRTRMLFAFDYHNAGGYAPPAPGQAAAGEPDDDTTPDSAAA